MESYCNISIANKFCDENIDKQFIGWLDNNWSVTRTVFLSSCVFVCNRAVTRKTWNSKLTSKYFYFYIWLCPFSICQIMRTKNQQQQRVPLHFKCCSVRCVVCECSFTWFLCTLCLMGIVYKFYFVFYFGYLLPPLFTALLSLIFAYDVRPKNLFK